jgi:hypothetical protein
VGSRGYEGLTDLEVTAHRIDVTQLSPEELEILIGIADRAVLGFVWIVDLIRLLG